MALDNPTNDSAFKDASGIHLLALRLIQLFFWVLLFVPAYLSVLLYIREQNAPPSILFFSFTAYGLFTIAIWAASCAVVTGLSPRYGFIEPFGIYLHIFVNFFRIPKECPMFSPDPFNTVFWLGFVIPVGGLLLWNSVLDAAGRRDRAIPQYFKRFSSDDRGGSTTSAMMADRPPLYPAVPDLDTTKDLSSRRMKPADEAV
ncbi:hypothetical protein B0H17DRAFT_1204949 [Mycena rosella]|uniref:Uncharacterized protein n=1 Tax=Mycena rosella TaxID=1033263 RepID=A0AAD7D8M5_MYCRO|nr:hypothetical protein B0H17DRAFT_1204949 [Mycena rosella]